MSDAATETGSGATEEWHDVDLPCSVEAALHSCEVIRHDLGALPLPRNVLDDALIVAGELVLNAVEHGDANPDGTIRFGWSLIEDHLLVRVVDAGTDGEVRPRETATDDLRGRGLAMVEAICEQWSVQRRRGTTVTARIRV